MKAKIKKALRELYGEFTTDLEHKYEERITERLMVGEWSEKEEWATYNQVIVELKHNVKDDTKVKELQYHLTDDDESKVVCIDVVKGIKDRSPELQRLYEKIMNF